MRARELMRVRLCAREYVYICVCVCGLVRGCVGSRQGCERKRELWGFLHIQYISNSIEWSEKILYLDGLNRLS